MNTHDEHIDELIARVVALEAQVQKLDRLVYKLFQRLPDKASGERITTHSARE